MSVIIGGTSGSGGSATFQSGLYIPEGWGANTLAAFQAGKARVAAVGDSIVQGANSSNIDTASWVGLLRTALQSKWGDGGSGWKGAADSAVFLGAQGVSNSALTAWASQLVSFSAGWASSVLNTGTGAYLIYSTTVGDTATWASLRGTTIKVPYFKQPTTGSFTWSVDGGAQTGTVNTSGASGIGVLTISGLATGTHTLTITVSVAGDGVFINGAGAENAAGAVVNKFGLAGLGADRFNNQDSTGGAGSWTAGANNPHDLVIYAMGVNDASNGTSADVFSKNVRGFLEGVRNDNPSVNAATNGTTDILLMLVNNGRWDNVQKGSPQDGNQPLLFHDYSIRMRGIAEAYGAAYINYWTIYRNSWEYARSLGFWSDAAGSGSGASGTNGVHPSDTGMGLMVNGGGALLPGLRDILTPAGIL